MALVKETVQQRLDLPLTAWQHSAMLLRLGVPAMSKSLASTAITLTTAIWISRLHSKAIATSALISVTSKSLAMMSTGIMVSASSYLNHHQEVLGKAWTALVALGFVTSFFCMTSYFWLPGLMVWLQQPASAVAECARYLRLFELSLPFITTATANDALFMKKEDKCIMLFTGLSRFAVELGFAALFYFSLGCGIESFSWGYTLHAIYYVLLTFTYIRIREKYSDCRLFADLSMRGNMENFRAYIKDLGRHMWAIITIGLPYALRVMAIMLFQFGLTICAGWLGIAEQGMMHVLSLYFSLCMIWSVGLENTLRQLTSYNTRLLRASLPAGLSMAQYRHRIWRTTLLLLSLVYALAVVPLLYKPLCYWLVEWFVAYADPAIKATMLNLFTPMTVLSMLASQFCLSVTLSTAGGCLHPLHNALGVSLFKSHWLPLMITILGNSLSVIGAGVAVKYWHAHFTQLLGVVAAVQACTAVTMTAYNHHTLFSTSEHTVDIEEAMPLLDEVENSHDHGEQDTDRKPQYAAG